MTSVAEELLKENQLFKEGLASVEKDLLRLGYALSSTLKQNGECIRDLPVRDISFRFPSGYG